MSPDDYLSALDTKLGEMIGVISSTVVQHEIDTATGIGLLKGQITFTDGSRFEFAEQLPIERRRFRLHYMDSTDTLIARWDSAPHHKELSTFPFHKHTPQGVEAHAATTILAILDEIAKMLKTQ